MSSLQGKSAKNVKVKGVDCRFRARKSGKWRVTCDKISRHLSLVIPLALPENVNYAVKSSFLLSFLESVPAVSAKLKAPVTVDRKFEDVVKSAQDAAVLVLVY